MDSILSLEPQIVWKHFSDICSIPHPSKHEDALLAHIISFAKQHNLPYKQDSIGNICITKPATKGYEHIETVCLQAHVDMVPQKNSHITHDFEKDPIQPYISGNVVKARNTTLGADNGIGLATILAILELQTIEHGTIEALFTVDEETGMTGAKNLDHTFLTAKYLINTDTEQKNEITIGCVGGVDANFVWDIQYESLPNDYITCTISINGLQGGHSGFEIHLGRANANIVAIEILNILLSDIPILLSSIDGGNMRNAIPREACIVIGIPKDKKQVCKNLLSKYSTQIKNKHSVSDPHLQIDYTFEDKTLQIIPNTISKSILQALTECPNGVIQFEDKSQGIVRTSTNLSIISTHNNTVEVNCLLRSFDTKEKYELAKKMEKIFSSQQASCVFIGDYPGWKPQWNSEFVQIVSHISKQVYGSEPHILAVHAGLECGIFLGIYPYMHCISFGPTIRNPHSPDEEVDIDSVAQFWKVLLGVLQAIPTKSI